MGSSASEKSGRYALSKDEMGREGSKRLRIERKRKHDGKSASKFFSCEVRVVRGNFIRQAAAFHFECVCIQTVGIDGK
jgi:hypothetical protein